MKYARNSCGSPYLCRHPWPDCTIQCGGSEKFGFFFEAFPRNPDTMLRGDSKASLEDAEDRAWAQHQRHQACPLSHTDPNNFERREYRNGVGFCRQCGFCSTSIFEPAETCVACGKATYYTQDRLGQWYCPECPVPEDLKSDAHRRYEQTVAAMESMTHEEMTAAVEQVIGHIMGKK